MLSELQKPTWYKIIFPVYYVTFKFVTERFEKY